MSRTEKRLDRLDDLLIGAGVPTDQCDETGPELAAYLDDEGSVLVVITVTAGGWFRLVLTKVDAAEPYLETSLARMRRAADVVLLVVALRAQYADTRTV